MTTKTRVALWEAINRYVVSCGGDPSKHVYGNVTRMNAVAEVEKIVRDAERGAVNETLSEALNSGDGSYRP